MKASGLARDLGALEVAPALGDDVDGGEERVRAVKRGTRTADDLDAIDAVHVNDGFVAEESLIENVVVDAVAVYEQEDTAVVITRALEAARARVGIGTVGGDIKTGYAAQDIRQRAVTVFADFIGADDADRGGRLAQLLLVLRSAVDRGNILEKNRLSAGGPVFGLSGHLAQHSQNQN